MKRNNYLSLLGITLCLISTSSFAIDAKSQLIGMAEKLSKANSFSVFMDVSYDSVQASGQKIEFGELHKVQIYRPNHFRIDTKTSDNEVDGITSDGSIMTIFNNSENVYSQSRSPGSIDQTIRYVVADLGMRVPLARMMVSTLPKELMALSGDNIEYVELNTLNKTPTHHIIGRMEGVDFQVWIMPNMLPERIVLNYKNDPGQPQFRATFSNWNLNPNFSNSTFTFIPQKGAEKIPTVLPGMKEDTKKETKGAE